MATLTKISAPEHPPLSKRNSPCSPPFQTTWFVYLLRCADQSLYCGITTDLEKRLKQHNGLLVGGAKYTKARQPCTLAYSEPASNRSDAAKREAVIKKLNKVKKEALVAS